MAQASREAWEDFDQDYYYDEILGTVDPDGTRLGIKDEPQSPGPD